MQSDERSRYRPSIAGTSSFADRLIFVSDKQPEECEWVLRAQAGDRAAFAQLVRRYQDAVYRFILRMIGSHEEALELTQDTFIKAWQALPQWQPQAQFKTWIFRIGSNTAMDTLRRRKVVEFVEMDETFDAAGAAPDPQAQLESRQRLRALDAAIGRLPPEQREAILLREVENLSYGEMAETLGVNVGTVKSRLARARVALAAEFEKEHP